MASICQLDYQSVFVQLLIKSRPELVQNFHRSADNRLTERFMNQTRHLFPPFYLTADYADTTDKISG